MLEKPDLEDARIIQAILDNHEINLLQLEFLPVGADMNAFAFRALSWQGRQYFIKLRRGEFAEISVTLPKFLNDQGILQVIPPLVTVSGALWASLEQFRIIVYPYISGKNGYETVLSKQQWVEFGSVMRRIHSLKPPAAILQKLPVESFAPVCRDKVRRYLSGIDPVEMQDRTAAEMAYLLGYRRLEIMDLLNRTEMLADRLLGENPDLVLCHSDLHAGNLLISDEGSLYIVDWDSPILAPRERDTMYAGGGQFGNACSPEEEESMFYRGYGKIKINQAALAYYRYERILDDIAVECDQIFGRIGSEADREQELRYFKANFITGGTIGVAKRMDKS